MQNSAFYAELIKVTEPDDISISDSFDSNPDRTWDMFSNEYNLLANYSMANCNYV